MESRRQAAEEGFVTTVVEDASRGVSLQGMAEKKALMLEAGIAIVNADDVQAWSSDYGDTWHEEVLAAARNVKRAKLLSNYASNGQSGHMGPASVARAVASTMSMRTLVGTVGSFVSSRRRLSQDTSQAHSTSAEHQNITSPIKETANGVRQVESQVDALATMPLALATQASAKLVGDVG
uniref:Uncharacterized protein n=1 Tax=Haptolina brevifila TaxID=156173 RepID=A0A7S2GFH0_9EUKA